MYVLLWYALCNAIPSAWLEVKSKAVPKHDMQMNYCVNGAQYTILKIFICFLIMTLPNYFQKELVSQL